MRRLAALLLCLASFAASAGIHARHPAPVVSLSDESYEDLGQFDTGYLVTFHPDTKTNGRLQITAPVDAPITIQFAPTDTPFIYYITLRFYEGKSPAIPFAISDSSGVNRVVYESGDGVYFVNPGQYGLIQVIYFPSQNLIFIKKLIDS